MSIRKIQLVLEAFKEVDEEIANFRKELDLSCLNKCGLCCKNIQIEATVLECLPVADFLLKSNQVDKFFNESSESLSQKYCLFYQEEIPSQALGNCTQYELRPFICRLFGFAGQLNKFGQARFSLCKYLKYAKPDLSEIVEKKLKTVKIFPLFSRSFDLLYNIDPYLVQNRLPINLAIREAIEKLGVNA